MEPYHLQAAILIGMCGIAGVVRIYDPGETPPPHHESIPESWLDAIDDSIKHRGPDGAGRFRDRATRPDGSIVDIALVHRRLSIIDHEGGHQPMVHLRRKDDTGKLVLPEDGSTVEGSTIADPDLVAVAFNGCIYNHRELREELETLGHKFETDHSDTEVLIHGWRAWGLRMQDELDGMYAMLIWDRRTGQLAWGRDLAGEKPLYQVADMGTRFFSSSPHSLAKIHSVLDPSFCTPYGNGIDIWISDGAGHIPAIPAFNQSPGVCRVIPNSPRQGGEIRTIIETKSVLAERKRRIPTRYDAGLRFDRFFSRCDIEPFESAVTSRLEADAPLGIFLSGGIDSALIAAIAVEHRPDMKAFTVRMPKTGSGPSLDESQAAAETAAHLNLDHTIIDCDLSTGSSSPANDLIHLIEQLGHPFGDSSLLPTYWVCRAARQHIKVALSGDGGDELFGGYRRHTINPTLNRYRHLLRLIPDVLLPQRRPGSRSVYLARLAVAARYGGYRELLSIFSSPDARRLMTINDRGGDPINPAITCFFSEDDPLRYDFQHYLHEDILCKTDTASMAVGLEVRAPFLARGLVDAALRTPLDVLMPKGERKGLLKQVARRYLPEHIINRPKRGFAIPVGEWFRNDFGSMRQLLYDHLGSDDPFPGLAEAGVEIKMDFVIKMLREHDEAGEDGPNRWTRPWHGRDHSQRLYMLLVLSIWAKWLDRVKRESPATTG